jgi:hypothetical protein
MRVKEGSSDPTTYLPAIIYPEFQIMGITITPETSEE